MVYKLNEAECLIERGNQIRCKLFSHLKQLAIFFFGIKTFSMRRLKSDCNNKTLMKLFALNRKRHLELYSKNNLIDARFK